MGDICRTCSLAADPATANNLFEPSSAPLLVQIENLTNIALQDDDNLPKWICQSCLLDLKIATDFRRVCIESQELLQPQLNRVKDQEEYQLIDGYLEDMIHCSPENNEDVIDFLPESQQDITEISEIPTESEYLVYPLSLDEYDAADDPADDYDSETISTDPPFSDEAFSVINVQPKPEGLQKNQTFHNVDTTDPDNPDTNYTCSNCGLGFDDADELRMHKYQLHDVSPNTKFLCDHCEEGFRSAAALTKHCRLLNLPCVHECVKCRTKFHNQILLDTHSEVCQKPLQGKQVCHICGKRLSSAFILKSHLLRHTGERPHKCQHCDASFAVVPELRTHMKIHSSERSYACRYDCGKSFRFSSARSSHERIHMDDSKRIHRCEYCPKSFVTPSQCRIHQQQHNMPRNHRCDSCFISFGHIKHYKNHLNSNAHKVMEARAAAAKRHPYFPH